MTARTTPTIALIPLSGLALWELLRILQPDPGIVRLAVGGALTVLGLVAVWDVLCARSIGRMLEPLAAQGARRAALVVPPDHDPRGRSGASEMAFGSPVEQGVLGVRELGLRLRWDPPQGDLRPVSVSASATYVPVLSAAVVCGCFAPTVSRTAFALREVGRHGVSTGAGATLRLGDAPEPDERAGMLELADVTDPVLVDPGFDDIDHAHLLR